MSARRWLGLGAILATMLAALVWRLRSDAPDATPGVDDVRERAPVLQSRVELPQHAMTFDADAGTWNVEVVNAVGGTPLAGARVVVGRALNGYFHHHAPPRFSGETDALGHVRVVPPAGSSDEPLTLHVSRPFFRTYRGDFVPGVRVVLEPLPPWRGRVWSSTGAPVAGARVLGADADGAETVSEADGTFVLALPEEGRVLAVLGDQFAVANAVDGEPLELRLGTPAQREGVVIGRDERPLPGVTVTASVRALSWTQTTGDDSVFHVPKLDGLEPALRFEKPGYQPEECEFREEVLLSRPSRLEGTLVDQRGHPLPGVQVELGTVVAGYFMSDDSTTTDDVGQFAFDDLTDEEVLLQAAPEDTLDEERPRLQVTLPEGVTTRVTLAMPPARDEVAVEYRSVADVEVEGCDTLATPVPPAGWSSATDDDPTLLLSRGRFHFEVRCEDGRSADETREVDPRDETPLRFVVRGRDGGTPFRDELPPDKVRVRVVTPNGEPIEGASISCGYRVSVKSDADGRATCEVREDDAAWPLVVHAVKDERSGMTRTDGKEEAVVTLHPRGVLRGRVDGAIPPGSWTIALRSAQVTMSLPLDGATFTREGHEPVRTFVCLESVSDSQQPLGCAISEAGEDVVIQVGAPGKVSFTAVDAAGAPIAQPIVYVDRIQRFGLAATNGVVEFDAAPGEHVMILNVADSRARVETRLTVKSGETTALGSLKLE